MNKIRLSMILVPLLVLVLGLSGCTESMAEATTEPSVDDAVNNIKTIIQGNVLDSKGNAVVDAAVNVEGQTVTATTAADGSFTIKDVKPGLVYLYVTASSETYLDGETLESISVDADAVSNVEITLSGRPSQDATYVGMDKCKTCHADWGDIFESFDGTPDSAVHSRFVTEGTDNMAYPDMWPQPGEKNYIPLDSKGEPIMAMDPRDGKGLVNTVMLTIDGEDGREYWFKFFPELTEGASPRTEAELTAPTGTPKTGMPDNENDPIWIPISALIGGETNWGEGYVDPDHMIEDRQPNFGEGKQRYMAKPQDVPYLVNWYADHGLDLDRAKQDYVAYMPVYMVQDGTPVGSEMLAEGDFGTPKFWQKSPDAWCKPYNTLSRNCAGCHVTGVEIDYTDVTYGDTTYKAIVTEYDYKDLDITCERCHGPGSEHASTGDKNLIITPQHLSAKASNELCGQCHASHDGKSIRPMGVFKPPFDEAYKDTLGGGFFVPGVYELETFYFNYDIASPTGDYKVGSFGSWPDGIHARAHAGILPELLRSGHLNNPYQKLTCYTCHDSHSLDVVASLPVDDYEFEKPAYTDNTLCLACHAGDAPFNDISKDDVAALQSDAGRQTTKDGTVLSFEAADIDLARDRVGKNVVEHMALVGMGEVRYTPDDLEMPVGNCNSCHMPQISRLRDTNDDAQYHLAVDENGLSAVAEGNLPSHVFDIVMPSESEKLKNSDPSMGNDFDIMANSCSKCHENARFSGDND